VFFPGNYFRDFSFLNVYFVKGAWDESKKLNIIEIGTAILELKMV
jgi:hypothetical protein